MSGTRDRTGPQQRGVGGRGVVASPPEKKRQQTKADAMAEEMAMGGDDADSDDDVDVKPAHLPAADPTPHPLVGRRVKEKFVGHGWFEGKVVSCEDGKFAFCRSSFRRSAMAAASSFRKASN